MSIGVERHARLQHLLNAPPARRRGLSHQQLGGDLACQRVNLHQTHAPQPLAPTGRGGLVSALFAVRNACSTESASCLGVTGLVRKSTKGGALWSRASASTSRP